MQSQNFFLILAVISSVLYSHTKDVFVTLTESARAAALTYDTPHTVIR